MRRQIAETVDYIVARLRLHEDGPPVDLSPLEFDYAPVLGDLEGSGVSAFAVPSREPGAAASVVIDIRTHRPSRKVLYAHEIGHLICGHMGSIRTLHASDWMHNRDEREAWEVAALLLIPREAFADGATPAEVAARCEVPLWLVEMYPHRLAA